jgi:DNA-binding response OmpR family regulator
MTAKILIVEDDLESLKLIGLMLQRRGYEIIAASAGNQGLRRACSEDPDLVILDVMMPDMDGYEVCQALRANASTARLPVIMFTAKSLPGDKEAGYRAGADIYLTKPIHPSELVSVVEELLDRSSREGEVLETPQGARVIGVIGAKGGVGTSTVTVNLAAAMLQHLSDTDSKDGGNGVTIVDLQTGIGAVSLLLGQTPKAGWGALSSRPAPDLSQEKVMGQVQNHRSGLRFLPAPLQQDGHLSQLTPDHVDAIVKGLSPMIDLVVLDLGSELTLAVRQGIALCNIIVVVVEPERLCAYLGQALLRELGELEQAPQDVRVVSVRRAGATSSLAPEKLEEILGHTLALEFGSDADALHKALDYGEPVVFSFPDAFLSRQFHDFAGTLLE